MDKGNRRRHPRIYRPVKVNYHFEGASYRESTMSLSMGGLYLQTDRLLEVGSIFCVDFTLPDCDYLYSTRGKVIWKKTVRDSNGPRGMGVKFLDATCEDKRALLQYLAKSQKTMSGY